MAQHLRKPDWLKIRLGGNEQFTKTKSIVEYAQVVNARIWVNVGVGEQLHS